MKHLQVFLLLLIALLNCKAQVVFCPPGAEWNYNYFFLAIGNQSQQFTSLEKIRYVGDTLIGGTPIKVLQHRVFYTTCEYRQSQKTFIKQSGDTVFFNNSQTLNTWQVLYNFTASSGQIWVSSVKEYYNSTALTNYTVIVDSTQIIADNGINLKRLFVRYKAVLNTFWPVEYSRTITERFGNNEMLFNFFNLAQSSCDADIYVRNLCYTDSSFGTKQFTQYPCDYSNPVGLAEYSFTHDLILFPNPAKEFLEINLSNGELIEQVILHDLQGKRTELKPEEGNKINIQFLPPGLYFLEVKTKNGSHPFRQKFIKE